MDLTGGRIPLDGAAGAAGSSGTATALATTGSDVVVSTAAPPVAGQSLIADSPTSASWQDIGIQVFSPEAYGAQGDGVQLWFGAITAGSKTFTCSMANFTTADIGKVIEIEKAGTSSAPFKTTIASINSTTSVELTDAAITTVTGVWSPTGLTVNYVAGYGHEPTAYYGTDDTSAIQDCLDAIVAALRDDRTKFAIMQFKNRIYILDGALQDTSHSNSQLWLKDDSLGYNVFDKTTIEFRGGLPPNQSHNNGNSASKTPAFGTVLKCTLNSGSGGAVFRTNGLSSGGFNFHRAFIRITNLTLRMPANPVLSGFDLRKSVSAEVLGCIFDTGSDKTHTIDQPTTSTSYALRMPGIDNGVRSKVDVAIIGFYNGLEASEHCHGDAAMVACYNALVLNEIRLSALFGKITIHSCTNGVVVSQTGGTYSQICIFEIQQLTIEHHGSMNPESWQMNSYDVKDAGNYGHGKITYAVVFRTAFTKSGGSSITCTELY